MGHIWQKKLTGVITLRYFLQNSDPPLLLSKMKFCLQLYFKVNLHKIMLLAQEVLSTKSLKILNRILTVNCIYEFFKQWVFKSYTLLHRHTVHTILACHTAIIKHCTTLNICQFPYTSWHIRNKRRYIVYVICLQCKALDLPSKHFFSLTVLSQLVQNPALLQHIHGTHVLALFSCPRPDFF